MMNPLIWWRKRRFISFLQSDELHKLKKAARKLGAAADDEAVELLIEALRHDEYSARFAAAQALGATDDKRAVEPLIAALEDERGGVQQAAARALGSIGDERSVEPLVSALNLQSRRLREAAARSLGMIGDKRAVEPLIKTLDIDKSSTQEIAARALGVLGDPRAVEPLRELLVASRKSVRKAAQDALQKIAPTTTSRIDDGILILHCYECRRTYRVGEDAKITTYEDALSAARGVIRLGRPVLHPDLVTYDAELSADKRRIQIDRGDRFPMHSERRWRCGGNCEPKPYPPKDFPWEAQ